MLKMEIITRVRNLTRPLQAMSSLEIQAIMLCLKNYHKKKITLGKMNFQDLEPIPLLASGPENFPQRKNK
jgi:hypothetical protein